MVKLVEIKDVRVGQIWSDIEKKWVIKGIFSDDNGKPEQYLVDIYDYEGCFYMEDVIFIKTEITRPNDPWDIPNQLIGKLGVTHNIGNKKISEIAREEKVKKNDIVEYFDFDHDKIIALVSCIMDMFNTNYGFITEKGDCDDTTLFGQEEIGDTGIYTYDPKKIGIYGVTHEFVNDSEVDYEKRIS